MPNAFVVGDVVRLKSGGPLMTVTFCGPHALDGVPTAECVWFMNGKEEQGSFPPDALEKEAK